jgi:sugar (pentulose or hexulose) kinase/phosphoglycerate dehydrogenase-like enzyme/ribulose-5-phosphate 4-epimerase/fuculose-1-phosphate aldolase/putative sterol carrier protein
MTAKYLMGMDVGGGGGRCLLVDTATGNTISAFRAWVHPPAPEAGSFAFDLDTRNIWHVLGETSREVLGKAGISPETVVGIAATSMRHGTVVIDKKGNVLLAAPNKDSRAVEQGMGLAMERGEELYRITGHAPSPIFMAARLLWMKEKQPDVFKSVYAALSISDWVGYLLTGEPAAEPAQAAESLLFDLQTRKWATSLIKSFGLPEKILPTLKNAGTKLGKLTRQAAANLGLPEGIAVAVGGPDTQLGLLGAGVVTSGQIGVVAGTTTPVQMVIGKPVIDDEMRIWTGLHVIPGLYVLESNAGQMGSTLEWTARVFHADSPNPIGMLAAEAETSTPGANGIQSTIGAAVFNASALEPPVDNLTFSSVMTRPGEEGRADVARAVFEGMAYAVRANVEQVLRISGGKLGDLWLGGGITRSVLWTRILSEVIACPVHVCGSTEATALGAALCAGVGAGLYDDLTSAAKALSRTQRDHQPGEDSPIYQGLYADWQSLRQERRPADMVAASQITSAMLSGPTSSGSEAESVSFRPKIYISAEVDETALRNLREIGDVKYAPYRLEGILLTGDDLVQTLSGYQVFVTEVDIVDAECLLKLPDLRMVIVCRGNPVNIDIPACTAASVPVTNTPARNADAVADLAIGFMLMLARRLQGAVGFLHQPGGEAGDMGRMGQAHEEFLGVELWHKTIGVIGGGAIGRKVIQRLLPFGARLLLFDPYLTDEHAILMGAEKVSFERLLAESDFISLHAPVTDDTRNMMDGHAFDTMKPGAFLINTARAALVDQAALMASLRSGRLGGAAFDVFPVEPPAAEDPLLGFQNVIATPHMGGNTLEVAAHQGEIITTELKLLLARKRPKYILNAPTLESFTWTGPRKTDEKALRERVSAPGPGATDLDVAAQKTQPEGKTVNLQSAGPEQASLNGKVEIMNNSPVREKMAQILTEFTAAIADDKEMNAFAKGKNVVFTFTVKDLDQTFFMSFMDGQVRSGLDSPPREPDVKLKMSADTLDGMFTGRVNATKAATSGKLSFSGDTGKAMSFIRIQGGMGKLYTAARAKIGDPGDLGSIASAPAVAPIVSAAATASQSTTVNQVAAPLIVKTGDVRDEILQITNELFAKGMITATGGNISARCDDNPNEIWITPSAIFKGDLRSNMMVRIDLEGKILNDTDYTASSERRVHCAIYKNQPEITTVIHTHAVETTMMGLTGTKFQPISADAAFFGDIPVVPFIMPGTDELGDEVAKAMLKNGIAVIMQNHGLVVAGSSLRRAADMTDIIEVTAHKLLTCRLMGVEPALLPDEIVKTLKDLGASMA